MPPPSTSSDKQFDLTKLTRVLSARTTGTNNNFQPTCSNTNIGVDMDNDEVSYEVMSIV